LVKKGTRLRVVGNIPYYLSSPLLERIFVQRVSVRDVFLTVQKEFAARITASPGTKVYGRLSCFVQYYAQAEKLFAIKRGSFFPRPKVDSCFLHLVIRDTFPREVRDEQGLFRIIRLAFNHRRKVLRNSLTGVVDEEALERFFSRYKLNPRIRPESLSVHDFINLSNLQKTFKNP